MHVNQEQLHLCSPLLLFSFILFLSLPPLLQLGHQSSPGSAGDPAPATAHSAALGLQLGIPGKASVPGQPVCRLGGLTTPQHCTPDITSLFSQA